MKYVWLALAWIAGLIGLGLLVWAVVAYFQFFSTPIHTGMDLAYAKNLPKILAFAGIFTLLGAGALWCKSTECNKS